MMKRALVGALALGLTFGAVACSSEKKLDKEGTKESLIEGGATEEQATCIVDGLDRDLDDSAMDTLLDGGPEALDEADLATYLGVFSDCGAADLISGGTTDTTAGG